MSWNRPPYNPAYSQAPPSSGSWQVHQQPYNPGYSQPPPTQSLSHGHPHYRPPSTQSLHYQPPPTQSLHYQPPPAQSLHYQPPPAQSLHYQPPPAQSLPPGQPLQQQPPLTYHSPPGVTSYPPPPSSQARANPQPPPGVTSELWGWFQSVDADQSGKISAVELRQALVNSNWSHFNPETCRLLIGMFDQNKDGTIDVYEFSALWKYIQEWRQCFDKFDKDRSGNIDASELQQALQSFGYRLSMDFCSLCTRLFDRNDKQSMKFDDFIQCCVMLRSLTEGFKRLDTDRSGTITISYEQFLELAIDNTL